MMIPLDEELGAGSDSSSSTLSKDASQFHRHEGTARSAGEGRKSLTQSLSCGTTNGLLPYLDCTSDSSLCEMPLPEVPCVTWCRVSFIPPSLFLDVCPPTPVAPVWLLCQGAPRWLQQVMQQDTRTAGISSLTRLQ